jgi:Acetyltransferase (GNAT) domain
MYSKYQQFAQNHPGLSVFVQPWYLDAVCGVGNWSFVCVEKQENVVAVMPFFLKKKLHWQYIAMPHLSRMMGVHMLPSYRNTKHEAKIYTELIEKLPQFAAFEQDCQYELTNWLPFYWKGFRQTTRYSYRIPLHNLETVWENIASDYKNNKIAKVSSKVTINPKTDLNDFFKIQNQSFERQGKESPISLDLLQKLDIALAENQSRTIFSAIDKETKAIHSALYLIWDKKSAYLLMAGDDPTLRNSGAGILLVWEAIQYAKNELQVEYFDFLGSMTQGIEGVRRQFGAEQVPYFRLQKENSIWWKYGKMIFR